MDRVRGRVGRSLDAHIETVARPRLDDLSSQIDDVRAAIVDVRRLVTDDLDASTETATLIGRTLDALVDAIAELRTEVARIHERLEQPRP